MNDDEDLYDEAVHASIDVDDLFGDGLWEVPVKELARPQKLGGWRGALSSAAFFFRKLAWKLWGRRAAVREAKEMFLRTCLGWHRLAALDRPFVRGANIVGASDVLRLTPADMCYRDPKDMKPSCVEPHHERIARIEQARADALAAIPRPPEVDDGGLTWALIPMEKPAKKRSKRTRGKSRR